MCSQGREQEGDLLQIQNKPQPSPPPPQISGSKRSRPHEHNSRTNSCLWGARVELTGTTPLQCARP